MNNCATKFTRLIALLLLVAMSLSLASCDMLPLDEIFGNKEPEHVIPEEGVCQHVMQLDGKCLDCGEIFVSTVKELAGLTEEMTSQLYYVRATVKMLKDAESGAMIIEDSTGTISVNSLRTEDGAPYSSMEVKPDEYDELLLQCALEYAGDAIVIKIGFVVEHTAVAAPIKVLTVAEALELCGESGNLTTERYYVRGTVKTVSNPAYGAMVIYDETGEISVYNTSSADGSVGYADMADKPVKGDEVLLYCTLQNYNGSKEIKSAWLIEFKHVEFEYDETKYEKMTIAEAREAEVGKFVTVEGVVARITYANGFKPSGVILVDGTSSIYVYDGDLAGQVEIGNKIKVAAERVYWILDSEMNNAEKFGYKGACQLDSAFLLENDKGNNEIDTSWVEETTVKAIMDTPVTENITNKIFKATALVKKVPGQGFVNYYIDDLDGFTGSYVYTQCNGSDFAWLDEFDGKFCTVYFVAINAKSSASGCVWRFLPISVSDDGYVFDTSSAAEFAVKFYGVGQFLTQYTGDPALQLTTSVSSELLGFEGATLSYASDNNEVVYFTTDESGVTTFHCGTPGSAVITVTGSYNGDVYSETLTITVNEAPTFDSITVGEAIAAENNTTFTVRGIVGPSLANQTGFYLIDESGAIAVRVDKTAFEGLRIGQEIIVEGTRTITKDGGGQICIDTAKILSNLYGNKAYSTESFITGKTVADVIALADSPEQTTSVYVVTATISRVVGGYSTNTYVVDGDNQFMLYAGGPAQYAWLEPYVDQTVTVELAVCDWNAKGLKGCVLSITLEDGTKIFNEYNFGQ